MAQNLLPLLLRGENCIVHEAKRTIQSGRQITKNIVYVRKYFKCRQRIEDKCTSCIDV